MISVEGKNIGIIGGGRFCKNFLQILAYDGLIDPIPRVLGVADKNKEAEGILYAKEQGIFTTHDHRELFKFKDLQIILELTRDNFFSEMLKKEIPPGVQLIDHFEAAFIWNSLRMEQERLNALNELSKYEGRPEKTRQLFNQYSDHLIEIINKRTEYSLKIERDLVEKESAMSQIIQGSVIPTFVINKDHKVIHWNKALEKLSGFSSEEMVGTTRQSVPFWRKERPTMADVVLDQTTEADIEKLYRGASHKSTLIEGALEAEAFFPSLGKSGKWCWFTAAPIHAPDGTIIGAIETLWDTTEKKIAEEVNRVR